MKEIKEFVDSKRLKAFSDENSQAWIYPQQQQARRFRGSISRGVGLEHVEIRMIDGQRAGHYKTPIPSSQTTSNK